MKYKKFFEAASQADDQLQELLEMKDTVLLDWIYDNDEGTANFEEADEFYCLCFRLASLKNVLLPLIEKLENIEVQLKID